MYLWHCRIVETMNNNNDGINDWVNSVVRPMFFHEQHKTHKTPASNFSVKISSFEDGIDLVRNGVIGAFICVREFLLSDDEVVRECIARVALPSDNSGMIQYKRIYFNNVICGALYINVDNKELIDRAIVKEYTDYITAPVNDVTRTKLRLPMLSANEQYDIRISYIPL